jgi:hypothetical protein
MQEQGAQVAKEVALVCGRGMYNDIDKVVVEEAGSNV